MYKPAEVSNLDFPHGQIGKAQERNLTIMTLYQPAVVFLNYIIIPF